MSKEIIRQCNGLTQRKTSEFFRDALLLEECPIRSPEEHFLKKEYTSYSSASHPSCTEESHAEDAEKYQRRTPRVYGRVLSNTTPTELTDASELHH